MTDVVNVGNLDPAASAAPIPHEHSRTGLSADALRRGISDHLTFSIARPASALTAEHYYRALALAVRDRMQQRWMATTQDWLEESNKVTCYLSAEFLMGPQLGNNLLNLGIEAQAREALAALGQELDEIVACEEEPGLGNGGLGRLAACYLDSLATLERPSIGYGIRYEFGIFDQEIHEGWQVEKTDNWLVRGNPWEIDKPDASYIVNWGGHTEQYEDLAGHHRVRWIPQQVIKGVSYDTPDPGIRRQHLQHADPVERPVRRVLRAGGLQHRRLLQGRRGGGRRREGLEGALPQRRTGCGQTSSAATAVLLRVVLAAGHPAHPHRAGRPAAVSPAGQVGHPAQRHPPVDRGGRADASAHRRPPPGLGRGVGDHRRDLRLHQPHAAARGAGNLAAGHLRRIPAPAPGDHLRDQRPLPRRGASTVPRRRGPHRADVAHRRGPRQVRADGTPGHRRQPRDQRCGGAALGVAESQCAQRLLRDVAGTVRQRDQRCDAATVHGPVQPGTAGAARRHHRRRLVDRPRPAAPAGGLRRGPGVPAALARGQAGQQEAARRVRALHHRHRAGPHLDVRHPGQADPRVQAPAPQRPAHHHAVQPAQAEPRLTRSRPARSSSAARPRPATSWPSGSSGSSPPSARR